MLQLKHICKEYQTGDLHQVALNDVSLSLRDHEFCSLLGPSGSGKSTFLNIIGGLDAYDSGDLIINGISTKDYNDRDWDSYRNHTIGFVFQSYNLIPHQNILSNVELALTLSGISPKERRERALEALDKVGLLEQAHKKPNQLSGGQMQRVAIARALVGNPSILLADEPTGALDTETSKQIMDLLKEVAKDRLVLMVTHNPELAKKYSTRIVKLKDGKIISDSNPYNPRKKVIGHKNFGKSSMSFLTALSLSFNNLLTKKGRTIFTAFAGSIGIIGIALIISLSTGVNNYIRQVQEDTLTEYPLQIFDTGMDLSSLMTEAMGISTENVENSDDVRETRLLESFLSGTSTNDLKSLKEYFDASEVLKTNSTAVEYSYPITPYIYREVLEGDIRRLNPDSTFTNMGNNAPFSSILSIGSSNIGQFNKLPAESNLYKSQYDVLVGKWPENYNEMVMVLSSDGMATDYSLYVLGLKDIKELDELLEKYRNGEQIEFKENKQTYEYEDFLGKEFTLVNISDLYEWDADRKIYVDKSNNKDSVKKAVEKGETLTIVGVVKPNGTSEASMLFPGVSYTNELIEHIMKQAKDSDIIKYQLDNPDVNIFTGKEFGEENDPFNLSEIFSIDEKEMQSAFGFDFSVLNLSSESFSGIDFSDVKFDINSNSIDLSAFENIDFALLLKDINVKVSYPELQEAFRSVTNGYIEYAKNDPSTNYTRLADSVKNYMSSDRAKNIIREHVRSFLEKSVHVVPTREELKSLVENIFAGFENYVVIEDIKTIEDLRKSYNEYLQSEYVQNLIAEFNQMIVNRYKENNMSDDDIVAISRDLYEDYEVYAKENSLPEPSKLIDSFSAYIQTAQGKEVFNEAIRRAVNVDEIRAQLEKNVSSVMDSYSGEIEKFMGQMMSGFTEVLASKLSTGLEDILKSMENVFYFNPSAFSNAININMDSDSLTDLMLSMATSGTTSYASNLKLLNYATEDNPSMISIYPKDFDSKTRIVKLIDDYNKLMKDNKREEQVISYSDTVATLMGSVTNIINTISYVLIAFVAISLVVSSIMIGIITYISVLERTKEIGILRAIGASKSNISQVFNAETAIIGFLAGIMGIMISLILLIPSNSFIHNVLQVKNVTPTLPINSALKLIVLSTILTIIGGIIPAKSAANKDPVIALRSE